MIGAAADRRADAAGFGLLAPVTLVLVLFFMAPVLMMAPTSLREYIPGTGIRSDWTFENYQRIFTDPYYLVVIGRTLLLGAIVTLTTLILGYPLAYFLARTQSRWRGILLLLVIFPLLLNLVVRSFGWMALLANRGLVNNVLIELGLIAAPLKLMFNLTGLVIGLTHIYLPFMVLMLMAALANVPRDVEEAAATLGAGRTRTFVSVILPLSVPGILAGSILVFVLTISALVTPRLLGGPTYKVMATLIYDEFLQMLDWPSGSALAFVLTLIAIGVIAASTLVSRRWAT
jgi:putative spermidine/putrescine transport system permease protein